MYIFQINTFKMPFSSFFGKGKGKQPSPQEAIQKLRETEEMLNKKAEFLEKRIGTDFSLSVLLLYVIYL